MGKLVKGETLREKSTKCNWGRGYLDPASIQATALKMYERIRISTNWIFDYIGIAVFLSVIMVLWLHFF